MRLAISNMGRGSAWCVQDWSRLKLAVKWFHKCFVRFRLMTCEGNEITITGI